MSVQDHTTHTTPPEHENHETIEGSTNPNGSNIVSDDKNQPDDDKEKIPSPKIETKASIGGNVSGTRASFRRSEEDLFSDAVTEFADSVTGQGSVHKTLDRDLFFSFNDPENGGTTEVLNAPVEISKVDADLEVSEKIDNDVEKVVETEIETDGQRSDDLVKDEVVDPTTEKGYVSRPQESESIDVVVTEAEKVEESQTIETLTEETKDSEISKTIPEVSEKVGGYDDNVKPEIESSVSEVKESETVEGVARINEEINVEKIELDHEITSEVAKESDIVTKESEVDENVIVLNEKEDFSTPKERILEVVMEPVAFVSEIKDLEATESEKYSKEQIQEITKEPDTVLAEKDDLLGPHMGKQSNDEKPDSVMIESQDLGAPILEKYSKEQIQEIMNKPDAVLAEKDDLLGPHMGKQSNDEKPDSVLVESQDLGAPILEKRSKEIVVEEPASVSTESQNLIAPELENCSKETAQEVIEPKDDDVSIVVADVSDETVTQKDPSDTSVANRETATTQEVIEQKDDDVSIVVADVSDEKITQKDLSDTSIANNEPDFGVVTEPVVDETNNKLINNQDSGAALSVDSSSRNSVEGNWGSVSVLSTASFDAESLQTTEKSKVNPEKSIPSNTQSTPPLITPEQVKVNKTPSSEVQDSKQPLTKVNTEPEVRNKNQEAIAKVTNWTTTGNQSTPLKNLLGDAKSPGGKQAENVEMSSPPKLIEGGENSGKKAKGKSSWMPFGCCSSVNVVN